MDGRNDLQDESPRIKSRGDSFFDDLHVHASAAEMGFGDPFEFNGDHREEFIQFCRTQG